MPKTKKIIRKRIKEVMKRIGYSKINWRSSSIILDGVHISDITLKDLSNIDLVKLFEIVMRQYYRQG